MTSSGRRLSAANPTRLRFHLGRYHADIEMRTRIGYGAAVAGSRQLRTLRLLGQRSWQDVVRFHQQLHQQTELACLFDG